MLTTFRECREAARWLNACQKGKSNHSEHEFYSAMLTELCKLPKSARTQINMGSVFEAFVEDGDELIREIRARNQQKGYIRETIGPVGLENFRNISGQIVFATIKEAYETPAFIADALFEEVPATTQFQEIIPGITRIGDMAESLSDDQEYPLVGVSQEWVTAPKLERKGFRIEFTEETLDELNSFQLLNRASNAATDLGIEREKTLLKLALVGTTAVSDDYSRNGAAFVSVYDDSGATHPFDNLSASTPFVSTTGFSNVGTAELLLTNMTDPNTGDPIVLGTTRQIVCSPALAPTVRAYLGSSGASWGNTASATVPVVMINNVMSEVAGAFGVSMPTLVTNPFVKVVTSSDTTWFYGDFKAAFKYRQRYPIQVIPMPSGYDAGWTRDVIAGFKARRFGSPYCHEPRCVIKCTA